MQPPQVSASLNAKRASEKDTHLRMAQKANHLSKSLVNHKYKQHDSGFHSIEVADKVSMAKK